MNEHPMGGPIGQRRGLDPNWNDLMFQTVLVEAPCELLAKTLAIMCGQRQQVIDPIAAPLELPNDENVLFAFQLAGHAWSQAYCDAMPVAVEAAQELSERLHARVLFYGWYHEGQCVFTFDRGELQESLAVGGEPRIYDGPRGKRDLQRRIDEGWQISLDPMVEYFSRQGRALNLSSADELDATLERVFQELGVFVANYPWWLDEGTGRVELQGPWRPEHFAEVRALYDHRSPEEQFAKAELLRKIAESYKGILDIVNSPNDNPDDLTGGERPGPP